MSYDKIKERVRKRGSELSKAGRDIAPIPKVKNPRRKRKAQDSLQAFCEEYFPNTFSLKWSPLHLKIIHYLERVISKGGLYGMAVPRGFGKTSICEVGGMWGGFTGRVEMACLIGAEFTTACDMLESIKMELETNDLLLEDYPEIVYPIRKLERIYQRVGGQLLKGRSTFMRWTADHIVLPAVPRSKASSFCIVVAGMEGRIRGMKVKRPDGKTVRPSLVIVDDPQTNASARSPMQVQHRLEILNGAILNLSGPGKPICGIMPCTVISPGDVADQILDREKHPLWRGTRAKLVKKFPKNDKLWDEYCRIYTESLQSTGARVKSGMRAATAFYRKNRKAMDKGSKILWKEWFDPDEISAIQHAMNLKFRDEPTFQAEYQASPLAAGAGGEFRQIQDEDVQRNRLPKGEVPPDVAFLTSFIDVHLDALYWIVCGWSESFTGYVLDYGTFPQQNLAYFVSHQIKQTLRKMFPGTGMEGAIFAGLEKLTEQLFTQVFKMPGGGELKISKSLVDANWAQTTDVVYKFCRQCTFGSILMPSHGVAVGPAAVSLKKYKRRPGDRTGLHWRIPGKLNNRPVKHATYDTNFWKSFVQARIMTKMGDEGNLSVFGDNTTSHKMFISHLMAEYKKQPKDERGSVVEVWKSIQGHENHWLDCLVGSAVAASMSGANLRRLADVGQIKKKSMRLSEMLAKKRRA